MTRETVIKGLKAFRKEFNGYEPNEEMFDMAIKALEQEPKTGYWTYRRNEKGNWENICSNCGLDSGVGYPYPYCPNCGAKMESEG